MKRKEEERRGGEGKKDNREWRYQKTLKNSVKMKSRYELVKKM